VAEPSQQRLDELEDRIDEVRRDAEEAGLLPDSTPEPTLYEPNPDEPDARPDLTDRRVPPPPG
jgi:hypothetical protein